MPSVPRLLITVASATVLAMAGIYTLAFVLGLSAQHCAGTAAFTAFVGAVYAVAMLVARHCLVDR